MDALGIFDDGKGHIQVSRLFHIHMADAGAGGDAGNGGIADTGIDQTGAAPGDQQVDIAVGGHQLRGTAAGGILHQLHQ